MEENRGLILYGCKLAKAIEENLLNLAKQPDFFLRSCDEIIGAFSRVKDRLSREVVHRQFDIGIQEWLRSGAGTSTDNRAMDLLNAQAVLGHSSSSAYHDANCLELVGHEMAGGRDVEGGADGRRGDRGPEIKPMDALNPSPWTPSSKRRRRRKDEANKIVRRVPAPQMGNLDLPPEDGFTWRKYGQKDILGCKHQRSYYRCTHQKFYQCPAKKQVQRLDDDFYTFEVTYRGNHMCNITSTAPSATIPPPVEHGTIPQTTAMQPPVSHWLSIEVKPSPEVEATPTIFDTLAFRYPGGTMGGARPSISGNIESAGSAGRSGPRFPDYQPVAEFADAMFNSGSSSNNSMELIFSSIDENWDTAREKKH